MIFRSSFLAYLVSSFFEMIPIMAILTVLTGIPVSYTHLVEYMYAHFDAFKLILCRAEGTRYANFLEELVELEVECLSLIHI